MDQLMKFFPFMPAPGETGKLIGALCFYFLIPVPLALILSTIAGFILGLTIIFVFLAPIVGSVLGLLGNAYMILGVLFAFLRYCDVKL